jgi:hypothetical protein
MDPFEFKEDLVDHLPCHAGPFPYDCKQCDKQFKTKTGQCYHMSALHSKKNPRRNSAGKTMKSISVEPIRLPIQEFEDRKVFHVADIETQGTIEFEPYAHQERKN